MRFPARAAIRGYHSNLVWRPGRSEHRYGVREACGIHLSQKYRRSHTRCTPDCPPSCIELIRSTITDQSLTYLERRLLMTTSLISPLNMTSYVSITVPLGKEGIQNSAIDAWLSWREMKMVQRSRNNDTHHCELFTGSSYTCGPLPVY